MGEVQHPAEVLVLILINDVNQGIVAREATRRERLLARTHAASLDRELAAGTSPEASAILALRALALVRPTQRQSLAWSLRRILNDATRPPCRLGPRIVPPRRSVLNAADVLTTLIDSLLAPAPMPAYAVAKVKALLHDGAGPMYYPRSDQELRRVVKDVVKDLDLQAPW